MASPRKQLHQPPHEFAVAVKEHKKWGWFMKKMEEAARSERDRERIMPSHPKPKPFKRFCAKGCSGDRSYTSKDPMCYCGNYPKYRVKIVNV